jgi:hypothetical protein
MSTVPPPYIGSLVTLDAHALYRVNGVPIWECNSTGGGNLSSSGPLTPWMVDGDNTIDIEVRATGPDARVEAQAGLQGADPFAPLEHQSAWSAAAPAGRFTLKVNGLPRWAWVNAERWNGSDDEIRALLEQFRGALAAKDLPALKRFMSARMKDVEVLYGPMDPAFIESSLNDMFTAVPDIRSPIKVERCQDGRIIRVSGADGGEPLVVDGDDGQILTMMGRWWSRIDGQWQAIS